MRHLFCAFEILQTLDVASILTPWSSIIAIITDDPVGLNVPITAKSIAVGCRIIPLAVEHHHIISILQF